MRGGQVATAKLERPVLDEIRLTRLDGVVLWRNGIGYGTPPGCNHLIWYGLPEGSADLIGICDGRFVSIEVKRPGRDTTAKARREKQRLWRELVRSRGGFATVVRSVDEYVAAIGRCREGAKE